jgi:hypothetical protein
MISDVPLEIHVLDYLRRGELKPPNIVEMTDFFEDHINYYLPLSTLITISPNSVYNRERISGSLPRS